MEDFTPVDTASSAASGTRKLLKIIYLGHSWVVQRYADAYVQMRPKLWKIKPTFPHKRGLEGSGSYDGNVVNLNF